MNQHGLRSIGKILPLVRCSCINICAEYWCLFGFTKDFLDFACFHLVF